MVDFAELNGLALEFEPPQKVECKATVGDNFIEAVKLLDRLPQEFCDNYPKWFNTGRALFNTNPGLLTAYIEWSKRSKKYREGDCERNWVQFENGGAYTGKPLGIGSLRYWAAVKEQPTFEVYTLDHLLSGDFRVTYLIDGYLVAGQPCICAGPQKSLKTTLLLYMALCLAAGSDFFGKRCKKCRVLFMSGESGMGTLQETVRRIVATMLVKPEPDHFILSPDLPHLARPLDELERLLTEHNIGVLVIDPAYLAMDGAEAGNMFSMGPQLQAVAKLCTRLGVTPIIAHHCTKAAGRENQPLELADVAWAGFAEFARQWLLLSRRAPYVDGSGKHQLFLRAGGSAGHSQLLHLDVSEGTPPNRHWRVEAQTHGEAAAEANESQYQRDVQSVRGILRKAKEPMAKSKIREQAGIRPARWKTTFPRLLKDGVIAVAGRKNGHELYQLNKGNE